MAAESTSFPDNWREYDMHNDLWSFASALYAQPGVAPSCLEAQAQGADVCLLLTVAWLGARKVAFSEARFDQLNQLAQPWQAQVVTPLRALRQQWRGAAAADETLNQLRENLKQLELNAERQLLERLELIAGQWPSAESATVDTWLRRAVPKTVWQKGDTLTPLRAALRGL